MDFKTALREFVKESFATAVNDSFMMYANLTDKCADRDEYEKVLYFYRIDSELHIFRVLNEMEESGVDFLKSRYKDFNKAETEAIKKHQVTMGTPDIFGGKSVFKSKPVAEKNFMSIIDICYDILCPGWLDSHSPKTAVTNNKKAVITSKRNPGKTDPSVKIYTDGAADTTNGKKQPKTKEKTAKTTTKTVISTGSVINGSNGAFIGSGVGNGNYVSIGNGVGNGAQINIGSSRSGNVTMNGNFVGISTGPIINGSNGASIGSGVGNGNYVSFGNSVGISMETRNGVTTAYINNIKITIAYGGFNGMINNVMKVRPGDDGTARITVLGKKITAQGGCTVTFENNTVTVVPKQGEITVIDIGSKKIISQNQNIDSKPVQVIKGKKKLIINCQDTELYVRMSKEYDKISAHCIGLISYKKLSIDVDNNKETVINVSARFFKALKSVFVDVPADVYASVVINSGKRMLSYEEKTDAGRISSIEINSEGDINIITTAEKSVINNGYYNSLNYTNNSADYDISATINARFVDIHLPNIGKVKFQSSYGSHNLNLNSKSYTIDSSGIIDKTVNQNGTGGTKATAKFVVNASCINISQK